ncbi:methyltransferase [Aquibacillus kalidii]|uniref:methyltransferase n=1 Tax=Aquibacillus kalidii TaxID=2762597 RepID=UPI00164551B1|nr:methyltransferase [Aquibacillus kalidii]
MDKVLVEIYVPASSQTFDVFVPIESKIHEVVHLVSNTMTELSQGYYRSTKDTVLCERDTGIILDINATAEEIGLINGSKLMLV